MTNYEAGLAKGREEGFQAVQKLFDRLGDMTRDRDGWKQEHENLLFIYRAQTKVLADLRAAVGRPPSEELAP